ncbi:glycerate kinase family protein [Ruminococcus flavefaciens]|uniref:Glycerate kinase n=1 Tax=Ruminococcus flavefaciens TaxID=1265 RepID=A0A315XZQ7_RUMFL|nr:glycerate kinase [Ruminococcus flavefaciens]PWJ11350.1 glycerate kinase [Ruminococcus flavefaciens]SSA50912.1 glycerate kinase [Ruminococcus flavefaciens]
MKVLIAIDSFKGSLTSLEAGRAAERGILRAMPNADVTVKPLADGGEGTAEALITGMGGRTQSVTVHDPLGREITAEYGIMPDGTAVMEMAAAAGLTLLGEEERDIMSASTCGVGEMIADAVRKGCRDFIIGIGGSATNDGGAGCLQALGFGLFDGNGAPISRGARGLADLAEITADGALHELRDCRFRVACDVKNPLCGEKGCSRVFAPQKGAAEEDIPLMDGWLGHYAETMKRTFPQADPNCEGAGAAGGMGFALMFALGAELRSGAELVMEAVAMEQAVQQADIVVTGEGCLDGQTAMGKAPAVLAALAKKYGKPVLAFGGAVGRGAELLREKGIDACFSIQTRPCTLAEAMDSRTAAENLSKTAEQVFCTVKIASS